MSTTIKSFFAGLLLGCIVTGSILLLFFGRAPQPSNRGFSTVIERSIAPPRLPADSTSHVYDDLWDWELIKINAGPIRLSSAKGKAIFLHLWGTWCGPCVDELPEIQRLYDSLGNGQIEFILVSNEEEAKIKKFIDQNSYTFSVYRTKEDIPDALSAIGVPCTFILDRKGAIRVRQMGAALWSQPKTIRYLQRLD
jgi:thiol-disulfide isomerase/thioredoxin